MIWQEKFEKAYLVMGLLIASSLLYQFKEWDIVTVILAMVASLLVIMSFRIRSLCKKYAIEFDFGEEFLLLNIKREMNSGAIIMLFIALNAATHGYTILAFTFIFFAAGQCEHARNLSLKTHKDEK